MRPGVLHGGGVLAPSVRPPFISGFHSTMSYGLKKKTFQTVRSIQGLFGHYTKGQKLVAEAVEPKITWGPETSVMDKIAELTQDSSECSAILSMIWDNISKAETKKWRMIYKNLLLLEHLLTYGSENCVRQIQDNVYRIRALSNYIYKDKNGNDQGINVRKRSTIVADLATDEDLKDTRSRAQENKSRYQGYSSSQGGGFYESSSGYGGSNNSYSSNNNMNSSNINNSNSSASSHRSQYSSPGARTTSAYGAGNDGFVEQPPPADLVRQSYQAQAPVSSPQIQQPTSPAVASVPQQASVLSPAPQAQPFNAWGLQANNNSQQQQQQQPSMQPVPPSQQTNIWGQPAGAVAQPQAQPQGFQQVFAQPASAPAQNQPLIDIFGSSPAPTYGSPKPAVALPPMNSTASTSQPQNNNALADLFGSPAPASPSTSGFQTGTRPLDRNQAKSPLDSLFGM